MAKRNGLHRQQINRGRVNYEPNSLAGGCPFQAGARDFVSVPEPYMPSPGLSLFARPGAAGVRTRRVAIMVAPGVDGALVRKLYASLLDGGAAPRLIGTRIGPVESAGDAALDVEISFETGPSVLWDGVIVADGAEPVKVPLAAALSADAVAGLVSFKAVLAQHRVYARETDPPRV